MLNSANVETVHEAAVVAATAVGSAVDLELYEGPIKIVLSSTASGTGVTNAVKITECDTSGGTYTDVANGAFTSVGNAASMQSLDLNSDAMKRFIKIDFTVSGGTGTGVVAAHLIGHKKYK